MLWVTQILFGLHYIHQQRILHRGTGLASLVITVIDCHACHLVIVMIPIPRPDLKTANIFIKHHDLLCVGDLGVAAQLEHSLDMRNSCVGTPYYLSPEVTGYCARVVTMAQWRTGLGVSGYPVQHQERLLELWLRKDSPANACIGQPSWPPCVQIIYELCCLTQAFKGNNLLSVAAKICSGKYTVSRGLSVQACLLSGCLLSRCLLSGCLLSGCLLSGCLLTLRCVRAANFRGLLARPPRLSLQSPASGPGGQAHHLGPAIQIHLYQHLRAADDCPV